MPVNAFDEAKNKVPINTNEETLAATHEEFDPLLALKQDKHSTATVTLAADNWDSSNQQTVNVTGVTANNTVLVSAAPTSADEYGLCGILCIAQEAGALTFEYKFAPTNDLTVNVVILGV